VEKILNQKLTKKLQELFWIYLTKNFIIRSRSDFKNFEPEINCKLIPIILDNYHRVVDFREKSRITEYRDKLVHSEIGYFAEHRGGMIGSIWASINKAEVPRVVRTYMRLMPNEGLIHDIVTGEKSRGMGVGTFMVSKIASVLITKYGLSRVIIDVNVRNTASLRMMEKAGLRPDQKMIYVSALGKLVVQLELTKYS
jgi:hypothetical protein